MKHAKHHHSSKYQININALQLTVTIKIPATCRLWNIWAGLTGFPRHPGMRDDVPHSDGAWPGPLLLQLSEGQEGGTEVLWKDTSRRCGALLQIERGSKPGQTLLAIKIQVQMQDRPSCPFICISNSLPPLQKPLQGLPQLLPPFCFFCHFWELHLNKSHGTWQGVTTARRELSPLRPTDFLFLGSVQFLSERREREC